MDEFENSVVEQEVADPAESVESAEQVEEQPVETSESEGVADHEQDIPDNVWKVARQRAEREAQKRFDTRYASRFEGKRNPRTGAPITTVEEYFAALDAQDQLRMESDMKQKGIDPEFLNQAIANNPAVKQAQEILEKNRQAEAERQLDAELKAINGLDSSVKTFEDLAKIPEFETFDRMVRSGNYTMSDAYKIACFDRLVSNRNSAAKQAAINAVRSKDHLQKTQGGAFATNTEVDIPAGVVGMWRSMYPGLSDAELRKKYNAVK